METFQYQLFKQWLIEKDKFKLCPNSIDFLYGLNRLLKKRICDTELFDLILNDEYETLYRMRHHYDYHPNPSRDLTIQFSFEYLGKDFSKYEEYEAEKTLSKLSKKNTLYIHQGNIACLRFKHPIADVSATITTASETPLRIHASYCKKCEIVFIRKSYYKQLKKQHKFMVANFCELSDDGYTPIPPGKMAAESPLMLCGYSVKEGGLSEYYRHFLLADIIYNGILSKTEIINYLEHFIIFNGEGKKMESAKLKWENDLDFVRNLDLETHPLVTINQIRPYQRKKKFL